MLTNANVGGIIAKLSQKSGGARTLKIKQCKREKETHYPLIKIQVESGQLRD